MIQDSVWHRGGRGAQNIVNLASQANTPTAYIDNLSKAREVYERKPKGWNGKSSPARDESNDLWRGLLNRFRNSGTRAKEISQQGCGGNQSFAYHEHSPSTQNHSHTTNVDFLLKNLKAQSIDLSNIPEAGTAAYKEWAESVPHEQLLEVLKARGQSTAGNLVDTAKETAIDTGTNLLQQGIQSVTSSFSGGANQTGDNDWCKIPAGDIAHGHTTAPSSAGSTSGSSSTSESASAEPHDHSQATRSVSNLTFEKVANQLAAGNVKWTSSLTCEKYVNSTLEANGRKNCSNTATKQGDWRCHDPEHAQCTALSGLQPKLIRAIIALRKACNCDVVITGGTETGHSTKGLHPSGYAVDLSMQEGQALQNYLEQNKTKDCSLHSSIDSACYVVSLNNIELEFHKEDKGSAAKRRHWHVELIGAGSGLLDSLTTTLEGAAEEATDKFINGDGNINLDGILENPIDDIINTLPNFSNLDSIGAPDTSLREPGVTTNPLDTAPSPVIQPTTQTPLPPPAPSTTSNFFDINNFINPTPTTPQVTIPFLPGTPSSP